MSTLFNRNIQVIIGDESEGIMFDGNFKMNGNVTRDIRASEPDALDFTIFNLSSASRSLFNEHGKKISIKCGYGETSVVVFAGDIQQSDSIRNGTEWKTHIIAGDGAKAIAQSKMSKTYAEGTRLKDILKDASESFGTTLEMVYDDFQKKKIKKPKVVHKQTRATMDQLKKAYDFDWSIHNGKLVIVPRGKFTNEKPYLISVNTGMIGGVEFFNEGKSTDTASEYNGIGVKFKSLMLPDLMPGMQVVVESPSLEGQIGSHVFKIEGQKKVQGLYTVRNIVHNFDTDRSGGTFDSSCEALV